jgi:3-hydroxyisobutyrate dehydrogenase-like beta-hydroxyacid dehydrogenase
MKLAANLLLAVFWQALGESLLLVDPRTDAALAVDILADSNIGAAILRARAFGNLRRQRTAALRDRPPLTSTRCARTCVIWPRRSNAHGSALPLVNRTLECFDRASYEGGGGVDSVAYPAYWIAREQALANGRPRRAANGIQMPISPDQRTTPRQADSRG